MPCIYTRYKRVACILVNFRVVPSCFPVFSRGHPLQEEVLENTFKNTLKSNACSN
ncbi:MAG: hypothetical protein ACTSVI_02675 [Promethearchaeota archaeon]